MAVYRKVLSLEEIMASSMICSPLKMLDCCANADGSSCILLASDDVARHVVEKPVWIMGLGSASDAMNVGNKESITSLRCAREAARQAYEMASIGTIAW